MLERILSFSVQQRWLVLIVTILIGCVGAFALTRLPIDAVPDITNNQVQINTLAASLSPIEVEKQVTFSIETALAGIPGLQSTRSISRNGFSQVTAIFDDSVSIYFARQQISERLGEARENLPPGAEPMMGPIATGLGEIYMYTVQFEHPHGRGATPRDGEAGWQSDGTYRTPTGTLLQSDVELASYLREVQDWIIRPQLRSVRDIAGVDTIGGFAKQYQVSPEPMKLISYGLTFSDVIDALEKNNVSTGAGYIEHKGESYLVRASGRIESIEQIGSVVLATRGSTPVYVRDVASVSIGRELRTGSASENGEEVVVGTAVMLLGANSRVVASAVDAKMQEINASLPPGIIAKTVLNRTKLVDATIRTIEKNLLEGAILVVVVLFLMLGNIKAALITACAIPLSMLMTASGMVASKMSGNLMSLGAIDFGLIVDGAVIIVENCLRRLAEKQHALGRTLTRSERLLEVTLAAKEMVRPSVFGQAIIITVYLPILALTGIEGKMFHPMAMTVIFALIAAFALSLTFVPAMVALLITGRVKETEVFFVRWAKQVYEPLLRTSLRGRFIVVPGAVVAFGIAALLFTRLGQEFIPTLDEKDLALQALRIPSTSLTQSQAMQFELERAVAAMPEVAFIFSKTGTAELAADPMPPSISDTFIILKPEVEWRSERDLDAAIETASHEQASHEEHEEHEDGHVAPASGHKAKLLKLLELTVKQLPGQNYEFTQPIQMRFNELVAGVRGDVAVKIYGDDSEQLRASGAEVLAMLQSVPGAADAKLEQTEGLPTLSIDLDREAIARHGLNVSDVQEVISIAIGGREAGLVFEGDRRFNLVVRLPDAIRGQISELENLPIPLPMSEAKPQFASLGEPASMGFVPLGSLAKVSVAEGVNQISRENGKRRIVVQTNVRGRDLGSFVAEAQAKISQVKLPPGNWLSWGGQYENLVAAKSRLILVVPMCFGLILLLLFGTFRSLRDALLVFSAVPLGLTGGVLALWLRGMPFSISAAVGFIALSGVAVLNGLVMVSAIKQLREEGETLENALVHGCLTRLRPVLMTALVASLGFVPMALASGTGAEVQKPLASVVIGGLVTSTLLTLVVLPALYRMFHRA